MCPAKPLPLPAHDGTSIGIGKWLRQTLPPPVTQDAPAHRRAAVLILLFDRDGHAHTLLTRRTDTLTHHPGQISLPGGRHDADDADLTETALREAFEELGIDPSTVEVVGRLDDVHTMASDFVVAPIIGVTDGPIDPLPNPDEIARVFEVPLVELISADRALGPTATGRALRYALSGEDVWGATARILRALVAATEPAAGSSAA